MPVGSFLDPFRLQEISLSRTSAEPRRYHVAAVEGTSPLVRSPEAAGLIGDDDLGHPILQFEHHESVARLRRDGARQRKGTRVFRLSSRAP
jgi:hypothetical protein